MRLHKRLPLLSIKFTVPLNNQLDGIGRQSGSFKTNDAVREMLNLFLDMQALYVIGNNDFSLRVNSCAGILLQV